MILSYVCYPYKIERCTLIPCPVNNFDHFYTCLPELLEEEISRTNIRLKFQNSPQTVEEHQTLQEQLDKLSALKYISQLRNGKLTLEDFRKKVELTSL